MYCKREVIDQLLLKHGLTVSKYYIDYARLNYQRKWAIAYKHVKAKHLKWFLTITIDKEKRNRQEKINIRYIMKTYGINYYGCQEYHGDYAIHYHLLIDVKSKKMLSYLRKKVGRTSIKPMHEGSINYVIKYLSKEKGNRALCNPIMKGQQ